MNSAKNLLNYFVDFWTKPVILVYMIKIKSTECSLSEFKKLRIEGWVNNFDRAGMNKWHDSHKQDNHKYSGNCGETLELLCDPTSVPNSDKGADLGGILECKTRMLNSNSSVLTLFGEKPKTRAVSNQVLERVVGNSSIRLKVGQTKKGWDLRFTKTKMILEHCDLGKVFSWDIDVLLDRYASKFENILSCDAIRKVENGKLKFLYTKVDLYLATDPNRFLQMVKDGEIVFETAKGWNSFSFRVSHKNSAKLFGKAISIK